MAEMKHWTEELGLFGVPLFAQPPELCAGSPPRLVRRDTFFAEGRKSFIVFNDQELTMEPIVHGDLILVAASYHCAAHLANEAWSSNCEWYFIVLPDGIALVNVYTLQGIFSSKKSAAFIQLFLDTQLKRKNGRRTNG